MQDRGRRTVFHGEDVAGRCQRFQALSGLHMQLSSAEEDNLFSYAFTLGMLLTIDIMKEAEGILNG